MNPTLSPQPSHRARAWRTVPMLAVLMLVVALLAAWLGARFLSRTPSSGSPDVSFAQMMLMHHSQAVSMAHNLRDRLVAHEATVALDEVQQTLKITSFDISSSQFIQMGTFQGWLELWGQPVVYSGKMDLASMGMATQAQVNSLSTLPLSQSETLFLKLMIRHHQGGVAMAIRAEQEATVPQVRALAGRIAASQGTEIGQLTELLTARGQALPAAPAPQDMPGMNH